MKTDFTPREDGVYGIAVQADGKIVAAGDAGLGNGDSRFAVARYNPDGTLDLTFGGDGKVTTQFGPRDDPVAGLALQTDGKVVVSGGMAIDGANPRFALARYANDGTLDTTFGGDGKVTTDLSGGLDHANALVVQPDGKILAGGVAFPGTGRASFALARYEDDGALDPTFSGDGKLTTNLTNWHDSVQNFALQPGGEIVAAGIAGSGGANTRFAVARYAADGTLDPTFSGDGKAMTDFTRNRDAAWDVALQADGKIVVGGEAAGSGGKLALARYAADGTLDATFSGDGKATANLTGRYDFAFGLALQADGKIVLAGGSGWGGANPAFAVARFHST